jgi:hypothetical protein
MKTYYIAESKSPKARTLLRAANPMAARTAYMRRLGYTCRTSPKTGAPLFGGDEATQAAAARVYDTLLVFVPTRTGRNPPVAPL